MSTTPNVSPIAAIAETFQTPPRTEAALPAKSVHEIAATTASIPAYLADPIAYRLVIEKDSVCGSFVYKTVDRATGETVTQLPSEAVLRLKDSAGYAAGSLVDDRA